MKLDELAREMIAKADEQDAYYFFNRETHQNIKRICEGFLRMDKAFRYLEQMPCNPLCELDGTTKCVKCWVLKSLEKPCE